MTYVVVDKAARMPSSCWGRYRYCAVVEVRNPSERVTMISERARNVVRIVQEWPHAFCGRTARCAHAKNMIEARALAARLNAAAEGQS